MKQESKQTSRDKWYTDLERPSGCFVNGSQYITTAEADSGFEKDSSYVCKVPKNGPFWRLGAQLRRLSLHCGWGMMVSWTEQGMEMVQS